MLRRKLGPTLIVIALIALAVAMLSGIVPAVENAFRFILPQFAGTKLVPLGHPPRLSPTPPPPSPVSRPEVASTIPPAPTRATSRPRPTATPTSSPTAITYVVEPGDTVAQLAKRFGSTVAAIAEASSLEDAAKIVVGQVLTIPVLTPPSERR